MGYLEPLALRRRAFGLESSLWEGSRNLIARGLACGFKERLETPAKVGGGKGTLGPTTWLRFQIHLSRRPLSHIRTNFTGMTVMSQIFEIS